MQNKIKTLIVDDERLARNEMQRLLSECKEIEVIGEATNGEEAVQMIEDLKPQLVFLDIQIPSIDGLLLAKNLHKSTHPPHVVFVTAYKEFAVEAFAESMLPVCDSLEAGLAIKEASIEQIREGADATLRQLKSALERNKVIAIDPAVASKFDPNLHQAISMVPADQEANTIVSVLQKGYTIADRVLRPALVMVAAPK